MFSIPKTSWCLKNAMKHSTMFDTILHIVCQSFFFIIIIKSFFTLMAIGDRSIGPSCWGSPAKTSCPPPGVSVLNSPARGTRHSGCREWPASSMNTWVKCWSGISPDTNLGKERRDNHRMIWKPWKYIC